MITSTSCVSSLIICAFHLTAASRAGLTNASAARIMTNLSTSIRHVRPLPSLRCADRPAHRFVQLVRKHHPHCLLHFEDFGVTNAKRLLDKYRDEHAVFNDDVYAFPSLPSLRAFAFRPLTLRRRIAADKGRARSRSRASCPRWA